MSGERTLPACWLESPAAPSPALRRHPAETNFVWGSTRASRVDDDALAITNFSSEATSSSARSFFASLEQPRRCHLLRPGCECRRRAAPVQRLDLFEKRCIGAQGREFLEQQCELALFGENV